MKKYFLLLGLLSALSVCSGCASSTGVMPWGPGVYSLSVDVDKTLLTSPIDAEQKAYAEAVNYCGAMGKDVEVEACVRKAARWHYNAKLVFRCIPRKTAEEKSKDAQKVEMF